jgi:hypothetical protein
MTIVSAAAFAFSSTISNWFVLLAVLAILARIVTLVAKPKGGEKASLAKLPELPPAPKPTEAAIPAIVDAGVPSNEILAMIAAVVRVTLGASARVTEVSLGKPAAAHPVDIPSPHWSMEGRRQIYSSHQIR